MKVSVGKHRLLKWLKKGVSISKIAKKVNITRQTVYRIKDSRG